VPTSINGTGTYWYGSALPQSDGSYVVTEWITFCWIPLVPLGSKRVVGPLRIDKPWWKTVLWTQHYKAVRVPLHVPHLMKGYAVTLGVVLLLWAIEKF